MMRRRTCHRNQQHCREAVPQIPSSSRVPMQTRYASGPRGLRSTLFFWCTVLSRVSEYLNSRGDFL